MKQVTKPILPYIRRTLCISLNLENSYLSGRSNLVVASSVRPHHPSAFSSSMSSLPFLDTVSGEIAFFRCLIYHRPVGKDRLSTMLKIHSEIKESHPLEYLDESEADLWRKYGELYDFEGAEEVVS